MPRMCLFVARVLAGDDAADVCAVTVAVPGRRICSCHIDRSDTFHRAFSVCLRTVPYLENTGMRLKVRVIPANSRVEDRPGNPVPERAIADSSRIDLERTVGTTQEFSFFGILPDRVNVQVPMSLGHRVDFVQIQSRRDVFAQGDGCDLFAQRGLRFFRASLSSKRLMTISSTLALRLAIHRPAFLFVRLLGLPRFSFRPLFLRLPSTRAPALRSAPERGERVDELLRDVSSHQEPAGRIESDLIMHHRSHIGMGQDRLWTNAD